MDFLPDEPDLPMWDGDPMDPADVIDVFGHEIPALRDGIAASGVIVIVRTVMADGRECQPGISVVESPTLAEWECPGMFLEALRMYQAINDDIDEEG